MTILRAATKLLRVVAAAVAAEASSPVGGQTAALAAAVAAAVASSPVVGRTVSLAAADAAAPAVLATAVPAPSSSQLSSGVAAVVQQLARLKVG